MGKFFIVRLWYSAVSGTNRFKYNTENGGWSQVFEHAHPFPDRESAARRLRNRPGSIWAESELKASSYYAAELAARKGSVC